MRLICVIALTVMIGAASAARAQTAAQVERGMTVFQAQKCSLCHSIAGKGNKKGPLDEVGSKLAAEEIRHWIVTPKEMAEKAKAARKPPMKAFPTLPKEDLNALVAYLQTLKKP